MSDVPRARSRGQRAKGAAPAQQKPGELPPARSAPPPPSVQHAAAAPPAPKSQGRGRAKTITPPAQQAAPFRAVSEVTKQLASTSISERGDEGQARGAAGAVRGLCRQRPLELVTRPPDMAVKQGKTGRAVTLKTNYFGFVKLTEWTLYQHRVDFEPDEERTIVRKALFRNLPEDLSKTIGQYIFDGTVLFTRTMFPKDPMEFTVQDKIKNENVRIIIKKTADLVMGDFQYLQVLNIILRKALAGLNLQLVGRDYYDAAAKVVLKDYNLEVWPGYLTSIRQHENSILMNVDLSSKIMRNDTAFDLLKECRDRSPREWKEVYAEAIVGSTVITRYNNATYRIDDVDFNSNPRSTFEKKGTPISYADYYRDKYNITIRNADQPLLVSKPKARDLRGGRSENVVLVPELCCLTGLTDSMRSNFQMMRALADHTRIKPSIRIERLEKNFMSRINNTREVQAELTKWDVKFTPTLVTVHGRAYDPETIIHGGNKTSVADREADFSKNLRGMSLLESCPLKKWVCIYPQRVGRDIEQFVVTLSKSASSLKFRIPEPEWEEIQDDRSGSYVDAIERAINRHSPTLIMCILMNNKADRYEAIKKKCCVDRAIPSQCVLAKNLSSKGVMSICTKIAIQINCKIGGSPWTIAIPFKVPTMIIGFDVTHDTKNKGRSVGALVASLNAQYSRYFSAVSLHANGEEISNDIAVQIQKAIVKFKEINKQPPAKLIFYRDGVGDGNIPYVLNRETEVIKEAIKEFYPDGVKLSVIIVNKKVNTRIFCGNDNPPPGTIVDDVITQPDRYDFFLISQSVRQGTVSPTYYNVIYDTTGHSPDTTQRLSYRLTHLYYNWSGTVRVPAPVQYAHKLAFLVGQAIHRPPNPSLEDLLYFL